MDTIDPRAARTRKALIDSFLTLALEHGCENLTIRAVATHANVGYTTFFRHFKSLDELLGHTMVLTFQALTASIAEQPTLYDEAVALYRFVRDQARAYRLYLSLPLTNPARQIGDAHAEKLIRDRCVPRLPAFVPLELSVKHIYETSNRLIAWYLDHLDECSLEHIVSMHYDLVINGTKNIVLFDADRSTPQPTP